MFAEFKMALSRAIVPMLICLLLAILILWQLASFFLSHSATKPENTTKVVVPAKKTGEKQSINPGLQTPFFGEYMPADLKDVSIKKSMLNLEIVGIIFSHNGQDSHVILRTASGTESAFHVGDALPGGVTIKRITADGVLVGHNGELESLSLPKNELIFEPAAKPLIGD